MLQTLLIYIVDFGAIYLSLFSIAIIQYKKVTVSEAMANEFTSLRDMLGMSNDDLMGEAVSAVRKEISRKKFNLVKT